MASEKPFQYHSGLWLFLSHITWSKHATDSYDSIQDSEVDAGNPLEKIDFADLVNNAKSVRFFRG